VLLSEQLEQIDPAASVAEQADAIRLIDLEMERLKTIRAALAGDVAVAFEPTDGRGATVLVGDVEIEFTPSQAKWVYDNPKVIRLITASLADMPMADPETGEKFPPAEVARQIVERMVALTGAGTASFNSWRTTALEALGIAPQALREKAPTNYTMKVRKS